MSDPTPAVPGAARTDEAETRPNAGAAFGISLEEYLLPAARRIQLIGEDGTLLAPEEQGTEPGHEYPLPSDEELLAAYRHLVIGRRVNDQAYALVRQGRDGHPPVLRQFADDRAVHAVQRLGGHGSSWGGADGVGHAAADRLRGTSHHSSSSDGVPGLHPIVS